MTTYTWVGASSADWNDTTNWDSGLLPDSTIDVLFNNANDCQADGGQSCRNFTFANASCNFTLTNPQNLNVYGNLTLFAGAFFDNGSGAVNFASTSTGKTITTAGLNIGNINFDGVGGEWTLQDNLSIGTSQIQLIRGSFITNDKTINAGSLIGSNANTRALTLGSSVITLSKTSGTPWNFATTTGLTFSAGTSTIKLSAALTGDITFAGGGKTYNNFWNATTAAHKVIFTGSNTFNNFKSDSARTNTFTAGITTTVSTMQINASFGNLTILESTGSSYNLVSSGTNINFHYCNISNCHASGATFTAYNSIDGGGNTGITFDESGVSTNAIGSNPIPTLLFSSDGSANVNPLTQSIDVTIPEAPSNTSSFLAYLPSTVTNKTGAGTAYAFGADALTKVFDTGNNLNTNGGLFTATSAGKYYFKGQIAITGCTIATTFVLTLSTTARSYQKTIIRSALSTDSYIDIDAICDMAIGDQALMSITVTGEAADTDDILGSATLVSFWCGNKVI